MNIFNAHLVQVLAENIHVIAFALRMTDLAVQIFATHLFNDTPSPVYLMLCRGFPQPLYTNTRVL